MTFSLFDQTQSMTTKQRTPGWLYIWCCVGPDPHSTRRCLFDLMAFFCSPNVPGLQCSAGRQRNTHYFSFSERSESVVVVFPFPSSFCLELFSDGFKHMTALAAPITPCQSAILSQLDLYSTNSSSFALQVNNTTECWSETVWRWASVSLFW